MLMDADTEEVGVKNHPKSANVVYERTLFMKSVQQKELISLGSSTQESAGHDVSGHLGYLQCQR